MTKRLMMAAALLATTAILPPNAGAEPHGGHFERHEGFDHHERLHPMRPPIGIVVPVLPPAYTPVWIGGAPYYYDYASDSYYVAAPGGFAVAQPPAAPAPAGNWYYCDSAKAYYPYVSQCAEGWRTVPATPPQTAR
jgi:hypothetical protein